MKRTSLFALSIFIAAITTGGVAHAANVPAHAGGISAHNIRAIQHTLMNNTFQTFEGSVAATLGMRGTLGAPQDERPINPKQNPAELYGRMPIYGTMPMYGEYGDDSGVFRGRNGGDNMFERPTLHSTWLNWQHVDDNASFHDMPTLDSDYNLIMFGLAGGDAQFGQGISDWGLFGGYIDATQENDFINIDEKGGFVGLYSGYGFGGVNVSLAANAGALYNSAEYNIHSDEYANLFAGLGAKVTYNIALDATFTLQPGVYGGYTWIRGANYTMSDGTHVANNNFNMLEVTPGLRAIKHIGNNWFGFIGAKYVFNFEHGGDASAAGAQLADLDSDNYSEYGIGIEKSIDRFNMSVNVGRRDGGRSGWTWGTSLKYIF